MAFTLATFNVKNLLHPGEESVASRGVLSRKLDGIAETLRQCDADAIGLQEVGPPELLRALLERSPGMHYGEPILGTADARGIRCALLSRLPVLESTVETAASLSFPVFQVGDPEPFGARIPLRRGLVVVRLASALGPVRVMVVHFKSPLPVRLRDAAGVAIAPTTARARADGVLRGLVWRAAEALHARKLVDDALAAEPDEHVAVVGDFNDGPESPVVRVLRGAGGEPGDRADGGVLGQRGDGLFDCAAEIPSEARFSVLHGGGPSRIDHVLATQSLHARVVGARFLNAALRDHGAFDPEREELPTADSDHAALVVRFE